MAGSLMQGFPPAPEDQVSLANWRTAPWSGWAFHHVREIVPSADIRNNPQQQWSLEEALVNLGGVNIDLDASGVMSIAGFMDEMHVDGLLVLHRDKIVFEQYRNHMDRYAQHILFSVSKSVLGMVSAVLEHQGILDAERPAAHYVEELKHTAYKDTTVRQLLDMQAAVTFDEDYLATEGPIIEYRKATGWNPLQQGEQPSDLRTFLQTLTEVSRENGGDFAYASPNTDLMAWVIERACNKSYASVVSEALWAPMGAEASAYITVDRNGAPRAAGGICTTLRDLARLGRLMAHDGKRETTQILPSGWTEALVSKGDKAAWNNGSFAEKFPGIPFSYRSKWYVAHPHPADESQWFLALGIHGQNIYVDAKNDFVMVKFSSSPEPLSDKGPMQSFLAARAIRDYLVNHF